jgi:hypothetical protein
MLLFQPSLGCIHSPQIPLRSRRQVEFKTAQLHRRSRGVRDDDGVNEAAAAAAAAASKQASGSSSV